MTSDLGLKQAIIADPDDCTVRRVYADWLEEHARTEAERARAEFIRLQIALEIDTQDSLPRREQAFRMGALYARHRDAWLKPYRKFHFHAPLYRQGFIDKVGLSAADLESHARAVFAQLPLRRLWVTGTFGDLHSLRAIPETNHLRELDLCGNALEADTLAELAELPPLRGVRELGLTFTCLEDDSVGVLCGHPFFRNLSLRCGGNPLSEEARDHLQEHFGPRVCFAAERDDDYLYTIQNERFRTGFGRDFTQILLYARRSHQKLRVVVFDHTGRLLGHQDRDVPLVERPATPWQDLPDDVRRVLLAAEEETWRRTREAWLDELGYEPATIRVLRFHLPDGSGILGFADGWTRVLETPDHPEWETAMSWLGRWLAAGKFAFDFGGSDWWLNEAGEVTDT